MLRLGMSSMEIPADQVWNIDQDTFDQIDKIIHDVKTRYTNWLEVVDEAVRIFTTWWINPPDAQSIFIEELWPHMTLTQHEVMKDPKLGQVKIYEDLKKYAEEYHTKKGTLHPIELELDTVTQNNAIRELKSKTYLEYRIKKIRYKEILRIISQAKSTSGHRRFWSTDEFMMTMVDLFITWWQNPPEAVDIMY